MTGPSQGYAHGGSPARDMERLGVRTSGVLDFSVSLNPAGVPGPLRERWDQLREAVQSYPSVEGEGIAAYYEERLGIDKERCLPGNGSTELIYLIPRVLKPKRMAVVTPSYHDYERASLLAGARVKRLALSEEDGFAAPPYDTFAKALQQTDGLWLARPNNPTGTLVPKNLILDLARAFPDKWILVDEAFVQFLEHWPRESLLVEALPENLLVIHSLTKFYAVPGLRIGAVVGHSKTIVVLRQAKEPWSINAVAERAATLLIQARDYDRESRARVTQEVSRVYSALRSLEGYRPFLPRANFILCRWETAKGLDQLLRHLLLHGLYVRDCRNFPGLEGNYFRIGLRRPGDNDRLLEVLASAPGA